MAEVAGIDKSSRGPGRATNDLGRVVHAPRSVKASVFAVAADRERAVCRPVMLEDRRLARLPRATSKIGVRAVVVRGEEEAFAVRAPDELVRPS